MKTRRRTIVIKQFIFVTHEMQSDKPRDHHQCTSGRIRLTLANFLADHEKTVSLALEFRQLRKVA